MFNLTQIIMKRNFFGAGAVFFLALISLTLFSGYEKSSVSELINANVEALAIDEEDIIRSCDDYCRNASEYVCDLLLSNGGHIYCFDMASWM